MNPTGALLTDLYQLTMLQGYFDREMHDDAAFEFFVRRLPEQRNFLIAAGLEQALDYLERLHFSPEEIEVLEETGEALLVPVMSGGSRFGQRRGLENAREHARDQIDRLPEPLRSLDEACTYEVDITESLRTLASQVDAEFH